MKQVKKSKILGKYSKKNHIFVIISVVLGIISSFFFGIDDQEAIDLYVKKLQTLSEHKIRSEQIIPLKIFYLQNNNRHPIKDSRHKMRKEFEKQKSYLKKEWQMRYDMVWPTLVLTKKGILKKFSFEAHHIVPINAGGINRWWNITPLSPRNHKILHSSMEEKACFSHDYWEQKYYRLVLKIKIKINNLFQKPITSQKIKGFVENFVAQI